MLTISKICSQKHIVTYCDITTTIVIVIRPSPKVNATLGVLPSDSNWCSVVCLARQRTEPWPAVWRTAVIPTGLYLPPWFFFFFFKFKSLLDKQGIVLYFLSPQPWSLFVKLISVCTDDFSGRVLV